MRILVLNTGSSTQKSCLYRIDGELPADPPTPLWEGRIEWSSPDGPRLTVKSASRIGQPLREVMDPAASRDDVLGRLLATLWSGATAVLGGPAEVNVVGHRIVHGGRRFEEPTRVTAEVKAGIAEVAVLAPEHNPAALRGIDAIERLLGPDVPQVAVFDTAFHSTLSDATATYPGPYEWVERQIRRYGFHGINHAWCAERAVRLLPGRNPASLCLITCHLGNGCSLAAIRGGRSVDTTMGFTPMEGLVMGSRSGSVDPGILLHLLRGGTTPDELGLLLNEGSGLKGLSGVSEDMRAVQAAAAQGSVRARLALDVYAHRLRRHIGGMLASLGGLDALVFTAGVGENSPAVRAAACAGFEFLGLRLDPGINERASPDTGERDVASRDSRVRVLVIPAQEDWAVARECWRLGR